MSHQFYNLVHLIGLILIMSALGGAAMRSITGAADERRSTRRMVAMLHGIGAFLYMAIYKPWA